MSDYNMIGMAGLMVISTIPEKPCIDLHGNLKNVPKSSHSHISQSQWRNREININIDLLNHLHHTKQLLSKLFWHNWPGGRNWNIIKFVENNQGIKGRLRNISKPTNLCYNKQNVPCIVIPEPLGYVSALSATHLGRWPTDPRDSFVSPISQCPIHHACILNILRPRQNGRHFADNIFKCIFVNQNVSIAIKISLKFVPRGSN